MDVKRQSDSHMTNEDIKKHGKKIFDILVKDIQMDREWLDKSGFFEAPCSTKYHLAFEGGLFEHSLNVCSDLLDLTNKLQLVWEREESPIIIGLFHDLCKCDSYIWNEKEKRYVWNDKQTILGHGDKSVILIEDMLKIKLTQEERECITYHMGSFTPKETWNKYTDAIHKYPNVLYTHVADMMSTHITEVI